MRHTRLTSAGIMPHISSHSPSCTNFKIQVLIFRIRIRWAPFEQKHIFGIAREGWHAPTLDIIQT